MAQWIREQDLDDYMACEIDESPHIKPASGYVDEVIERITNPASNAGALLPWLKYHNTIQFRKEEVTEWYGCTSHGKSLLMGQVFTCFMAQGEQCGILSFEMKPVTTLTRMCKQASLGDNPTESFIRKYHSWCHDKLWMYDQRGTVRKERVLACCRYMAKTLGITQIVIDSFMKCGIRDDDLDAHKMFADELCAIAKDYGIHIHLINHAKKLQNLHDVPTQYDSKGSGTVADQVDNRIIIFRNKKKEEAKWNPDKSKYNPDDMDGFIDIIKQRNGEETRLIPLWFLPSSKQFVCSPGGGAVDLMKFERF